MNVYSPGSLIDGRYEVAGRPLLGGMGLVYLCFDHQEQRPVALKTFRPEYLPDRTARDRFLREGSTWVALGRHPHMVRCYQVVRIGDGREVYLVLELVAKEEGRADASLRSWLAPGRPLPVEQALLFALQVAWGMAHAVRVQPGLVHRDLKPENLLVGADKLPSGINRLRITDFGLANVLQGASSEPQHLPRGAVPERVASEGWPDGERNPGFHSCNLPSAQPLARTQLTHSGIVGTPLYMAPEQWQGRGVCLQTDVYALGCILFEMLAGQPAAEGGTLAALERAHRAGQVRPLPGGVPDVVGEVVRHCLATEAAARYGSWEAAAAALVGSYAAVAGRSALPPAVDDGQPAGGQERAERVAAGWSYSEIGASYLDLGKAEVAAGYFERARQAAEAEGERRLEAAGLTHLGVAYAALGDAQRAIGCHEQALVSTREIGDRRGEGANLNDLGLAYADLGDARRAIGCFEQALVIDREIGDRWGESNALGSLGNAYAALGDERRAVGCYEQWFEIACEIGDRRGEGNALGSLGNAYAALGDARRAIGYHEQALAIHREIGDRRGEGNALGNLGTAYADLGDARRAIGYYEQCLCIHREIADRRGQGADLGNLGNAYADLGDTRRAIDCYEQWFETAREIGDRRGEGAALGNLGVAYAALGDTRQAIRYYEQCSSIHREIEDVNGEATDLFNLAGLYGQQGDLARALLLAQKAARLFAQIGHAQHAQRAQQLVARLQSGQRLDAGPSPAQILQKLEPVIAAVIAGVQGDRQARAAVEAVFDTLTRNGWRIVEPIRRLWASERDEARLTAGIDANSALIVREILKRLQG